MSAIRSLIFTVFFLTWTGVILVGFSSLFLFPRPYMQRAVRLWGQVTRTAMKWIVGTDFEIRGRENILPVPAIYASKHQSAWDTTIFHLVFDDPAYVLKKELMSIPFWGLIARKCGAIIVDRARGASAIKGLIRGAAAALKAGQRVIIFPEGTRTAPGRSLPYYPGVAAIYSQTAAPVVPVALNSGLFWGRRNIIKRPGTIVVEFLPPIPPGLDRATFMSQLEDRIETASRRLIEEAEAKEKTSV